MNEATLRIEASSRLTACSAMMSEHTLPMFVTVTCSGTPARSMLS